MSEMIRNELSEATFIFDNGIQLLFLGKSSSNEDVWFISAKRGLCEIGFFPMHKSILEKELPNGKYVGRGKIDEEFLVENLKYYNNIAEANGFTDSYFSVGLKELFDLLPPSPYGNYYPMLYPTNKLNHE